MPQVLSHKIEMTLDCGFFTPQPRVTSVHSWYLTSFLILSFLVYPLLFLIQPQTHSFLHFSSENTAGLLFVFLFAKGEFLIRSSIETISHTAILGTHIYFLRYTAVSIIFLFSFSSHFTRSFRPLGSLLRNLNFSLDDSPVSLGLSVWLYQRGARSIFHWTFLSLDLFLQDRGWMISVEF